MYRAYKVELGTWVTSIWEGIKRSIPVFKCKLQAEGSLTPILLSAAGPQNMVMLMPQAIFV